jgi:hypothetical protein
MLRIMSLSNRDLLSNHMSSLNLTLPHVDEPYKLYHVFVLFKQFETWLDAGAVARLQSRFHTTHIQDTHCSIISHNYSWTFLLT